MKHPAAPVRKVSVEEEIEELGDLISIIIRSFGSIRKAHIYEQLEALIEERRHAHRNRNS